jgi:hypothetical protein
MSDPDSCRTCDSPVSTFVNLSQNAYASFWTPLRNVKVQYRIRPDSGVMPSAGSHLPSQSLGL